MENNFNQKVERKHSDSVKWIKQKYEDSLPFWVADSDYNTYSEVKDEIINVASNTIFGYSVIPDKFYESISSWYKRYNSEVDTSWISAQTGVITSIRVILDALTKEGDGVILQTPVYHTFHKVINGMKRVIIENKLKKVNDTYQMDFDNLEELFKKGHKVMILCSPHNPVGRLWTKEELTKLKDLVIKYSVSIISDEIHSDLNITNNLFYSMINFKDIHPYLYVCNAPSKAFNIAGLSTSYVIIPNEKRKEDFDNLVSRDCLPSPTIFGVRALIKAYNTGDNFIKEQNKHILNNYNYLKEYLNETIKEIIVTKLEATYLVWLDLSYLNKTCEEITKILDDAHITCSSGKQFCNDYGSFIRFNIACPKEQLKEGLDRLIGALNETR